MSDAVVVVGCGHIGAPLAIWLAQGGFNVYGVDSNPHTVEQLNKGILPVVEEGYQELLGKMLEAGNLKFMHPDADALRKISLKTRSIILTLGTEVDSYGYPQVGKFLSHALWYVSILAPRFVFTRSTVAVGTNRELQNRLKLQGFEKLTTVVSAPERIAEGKAFKELGSLPQIIGLDGLNNSAIARANAMSEAQRLFINIPSETVVTYEEAEMAKLMSNAWRYITFAAANEFGMLADKHDLSFNKIRDVMMHEYPRNKGLPRQGLAAGPCLRKDSLQLVKEHMPTGLTATAVETNEYYAMHVVNNVLETLERYPYVQRVVLVGMAFKDGVADLRDSLSIRVLQSLQDAGVRPMAYDPMVENLDSYEDVVADYETKFYVWLHSPKAAQYEDLAKVTFSGKNLNYVV